MSATLPERWRLRSRAAGFSLVTGIVILLLLAGIAAYTLKVSTAQHASSAADVQGTRALQAAKAGIEWGAYQVLQGSLSTGYCNGGSSSESFGGLAADLAGFNVVVTCARTDHTEAGNAVRMYTLTATACNRATCPGTSAGANYVERQLTAVVSR